MAARCVGGPISTFRSASSLACFLSLVAVDHSLGSLAGLLAFSLYFASCSDPSDVQKMYAREFRTSAALSPLSVASIALQGG